MMLNSKIVLVVCFILFLLMCKSEIKGQKFQHGSSWVTSVKFLPDGKSLISSSFDGTLIKWDLQSGKQVWKLDFDEKSKTSESYTVSHIVGEIGISLDGDTVAVSYSQSSVVNNTAQADRIERLALISTESGKITKILTSGTSVGKPVFSPKNNFLLFYVDGYANLRDVITGETLLEVKLEGGAAYTAFSPDGRTFAIASGPIWQTPAPSLVKLYYTETGKLVREFPREYSEVTGIAFSPDGKSLLIGGFKMPDVITKQWNLDLPNDQSSRVVLAEDKKNTGNYIFSPDGKFLAYSMFNETNSSVVIREFSSYKVFQKYKVDSEIESIDFSVDGKKLVYGTRKGRIAVHSLQ